MNPSLGNKARKRDDSPEAKAKSGKTNDEMNPSLGKEARKRKYPPAEVEAQFWHDKNNKIYLFWEMKQ